MIIDSKLQTNPASVHRPRYYQVHGLIKYGRMFVPGLKTLQKTEIYDFDGKLDFWFSMITQF